MNDINVWLAPIACICIGVALSVGGYTDWKYRIIPNAVPVFMFLFGFFTATPMKDKFVALAAVVIILLLASIVTKSKSGGGDTKTYWALTFGIGLFGFAFTYLLSALLWVGHKKLKKEKAEKKERFPACTYLAVAYWIYLLMFGGLL